APILGAFTARSGSGTMRARGSPQSSRIRSPIGGDFSETPPVSDRRPYLRASRCRHHEIDSPNGRPRPVTRLQGELLVLFVSSHFEVDNVGHKEVLRRHLPSRAGANR